VSAFESRSSNDLHIVQPAQFESMVEKQATELDVKESPDMYEASYHMIDENDIEEDSQVIVSASSNSHEAMFMQMQHLLEKRMSAPAYELFQAHFC
jgi:ferredoxin-NADP reductase